MRYYLSPSLMCMDMMKLTEQLRFLNSKADRLHVDIMDGHYVKNLALSASFVAQIRPYTSLPIDVHLMVEAPASFIPALLDAGADAFSLHPETICREAFRVINMLRQAGKEVGMVLNPATPVESIQHYLHLLDKVTVMTVDPGYAGQPFIPEMLAKITQLHQLKETGSLRFLQAGALVILNPAPWQPVEHAVLSKVDLLTPNATEAGLMTGRRVDSLTAAAEAADVLHAQGARNVIITLGASGALLSELGVKSRVPCFPSHPRDTTGAGDAFNGALAARLACGEPLQAAARFAAAYAAVSVEKQGASSLPEYLEAQERLLRAAADYEMA
ncbi:hypothetical protein BCV49_14070 [Klebsiella pneumoniae]|nr:hypothetical protein BCV49_14070 [Klebsiella pneumoniae]